MRSKVRSLWHFAACAESPVLMADLVRSLLAKGNPSTTRSTASSYGCAVAPLNFAKLEVNVIRLNMDVCFSRSRMEEASLPGGYLLRELIGAGGLANVYRAEHGPLGRSVAIKMLHPHLVHEVDIVRRFENEARMARLIQHPHSLSVLDIGRTAKGQPYLVMEYVRGRNLALLMHEEGPLEFHRIIDIVVQVLDALREAHGKRIIHRDLKPGNVLVTTMQGGSDFARIMDFGLAVRLADAPPGPNQSATVCGTPDFMSPEQCRGEALDPRSDLYAVGAMLYLLLTEHLPFQAESPAIVMQMQVSERVRDPREVALQRGISEELADITNKALAKHPADRFQSAEELIESLRRADHHGRPNFGV